MAIDTRGVGGGRGLKSRSRSRGRGPAAATPPAAVHAPLMSTLGSIWDPGAGSASRREKVFYIEMDGCQMEEEGK